MIPTASLSFSAFGLAMIAAGFVLGLGYFAALRRTVGLLVGRGGWFAPLALTLGRVAGAVLVLAAVARLGAVALLAVGIGFWLARAAALRMTRDAA